MLLGVVQDYTINWGAKGIEAFVENRSPDQIRGSLEQYLRQYKFKEFAENAVRAVPVETIEAALGEGIGVLVDFVYGHIVAKRKQALRTMGNCAAILNLMRSFERHSSTICRNLNSPRLYVLGCVCRSMQSGWSQFMR